jgi:hypothetical protein
VASYVLLVLCLGIIPIAMLYFISNNINIYQKNKFKDRYGSLFEDLELRSKWSAGFYLVYCLRRIVFCLVIFGMKEFSGLQLLVLNLMNLLILIYTGLSQPLIGRLANRLEMANELSVCFISFHWYFFTDWVLDENHQTNYDLHYKYGIMMNCFVSYYLYYNLMVILNYNLHSYMLLIYKFFRVIRNSLCDFGTQYDDLGI